MTNTWKQRSKGAWLDVREEGLQVIPFRCRLLLHLTETIEFVWAKRGHYDCAWAGLLKMNSPAPSLVTWYVVFSCTTTSSQGVLVCTRGRSASSLELSEKWNIKRVCFILLHFVRCMPSSSCWGSRTQQVGCLRQDQAEELWERILCKELPYCLELLLFGEKVKGGRKYPSSFATSIIEGIAHEYLRGWPGWRIASCCWMRVFTTSGGVLSIVPKVPAMAPDTKL